MQLRTASLVSIGIVVALASLRGVAQSAQTGVETGSRPRFEVVSIKPSSSDEPGSRVSAQPSGRFVMTGVPVSAVVLTAYELADYFQADGFPEWSRKDRFDIVAQAPPGVSIAFPGQGTALPRMLQAMLVERMKLATHVEKRALPMFAMVVARTDRTLGPNLTRSSIDCTTVPSPPVATGGQTSSAGATECGTRATLESFSARGIPLDRLIRLIIAPRVGRPVLDRTGLTGTFDVNLRFRGPELPAGAVAAGVAAPTLDPDLPPIETAVEEQLGLKLQPIREQSDVLVIDHLERPGPD